LQHARIVRRAKEIEALIERPDAVSLSDVQVIDSVLSPGYGKLNLETHSAISMAARLEGLFLDPVYTGKTMAGLMHLVTTGEIPRGNRVLFVHTGGLPALFGYERSLCEHLNDIGPDAHSGPASVARGTM
jgi:1-aminocyclopropane-1-carboxylate deaminase/D-cysteine desulfhydrase-like pyridoxal-dependent ACC family enzyme